MKNTSLQQKKLHELRSELNFKRQNRKIIRHIYEDIIILTVVVVAFSYESLAGYILAQLGLVCFFFRSFGVMHEAVHYNLSDSKSVNNFFGVFYGAFCFLPFFNWRKIHLQHHLWAGNIDQDPVMQLVKQIPEYSNFRMKLANLCWRLWIPYLAFMQHIIFWKESLRLVINKPKDILLAASIFPPLLFLLASFFLSIQYPWFGIFPALFIYLNFVEAINFPHHLGLAYTDKRKRLSYMEQYKIARSCYYNGVVSRFFYMNFNFHIEHHIYPNLPWHQLPKAAKYVKDILGSEYNSVEGHEWISHSRSISVLEVVRKKESDLEEVA